VNAASVVPAHTCKVQQADNQTVAWSSDMPFALLLGCLNLCTCIRRAVVASLTPQSQGDADARGRHWWHGSISRGGCRRRDGWLNNV
jgi:hypothetical protein